MIKQESKTIEVEVEIAYCDICKERIGEFTKESGGRFYRGEQHSLNVNSRDIHADCLEKVCM